MGSGLNRTEILRKDCQHCNGNGYIITQSDERPCGNCDAIGYHEVEVPYKFDGDRTQDEIDSFFT